MRSSETVGTISTCINLSEVIDLRMASVWRKLFFFFPSLKWEMFVMSLIKLQ